MTVFHHNTRLIFLHGLRACFGLCFGDMLITAVKNKKPASWPSEIQPEQCGGALLTLQALAHRLFRQSRSIPTINGSALTF